MDNYGHIETHPERLYWFYNNLKEYPLCHCGNRTKFINIHQGYRINCSSKCVGLNPDVINAKKQTSLKNYGVENPAQCINLKSNYKQTCLEKYGADKLFQYFIKNYHPESIASFSMNDFSKGDIYNKLGFKSGNINNVYWYFEPRTLKRDHRSCWNKSSIVKKKIKDKIDGTWTEIDTMKSLNYFQIYDSGQTKWVWKNKKDLL